ncbi:MAG TPA: SGNH/GDSL hydrolase family protein [Tepidisphaeraceae bacterium]|nr:SGNH/GDSL hydrolase family protein [Tepidisphaeraceae bacterium]
MPLSLSAILSLLVPLLSPVATPDAPKELILKKGDRIVAMGDSITAGGAKPGGYLRIVDQVLAEQYPDLAVPPIVGAGISGNKAENMAARFEKDVIAKKPNVVTINVGINDVWHRLKEPHKDEVLAKHTENVTKMVDLAQAAGAKVILIAPPLIQEDLTTEGNKRLLLYVAAQREIAKAKNCTFIDLHQMFRTAVEKRPEQIGKGSKGNNYTSDGVHMAAPGNAIMAIAVLKGLGVPDEKIKVAEKAVEKK